ncbi:membrane protein insertion efficiency factor YidD [Flagellimonas beolgyonensis]|uniref:membrane protein insertion efficiency factor YidD n=1 Tax=Flagellimonas beolgyonensis TaxID=864064 RepID=UPI003D65FC68
MFWFWRSARLYNKQTNDCFSRLAMKYPLLLLIRLYWLIVPKTKRKKCIFRESCSQHVYRITLGKGFGQGLRAFHFRYKNCRYGYEIFRNPISKEIQLILPNKEVLCEDEIAERLLKSI